jgi:hypothetical protein
MTRKQLIKALSKRLGVKLVDNPDGSHRSVLAVSKNGTTLFHITLFQPTPGHWMFGGCGGLLGDCWSELCRLGEPPLPQIGGE